MVSRHIGEPFLPPHIGWYLAGLIDGEGCFSVSRVGQGWRCAFIIKLRADDRPLLEQLRAAVGLGTVRDEATPSRVNPCARWEIQRKDECLAFIDMLADYPLRSKKARDAQLWSRAVEAWATVYPNEKADWSEIAALAEEIREARRFVPVEGVA